MNTKTIEKYANKFEGVEGSTVIGVDFDTGLKNGDLTMVLLNKGRGGTYRHTVGAAVHSLSRARLDISTHRIACIVGISKLESGCSVGY